MGTKNKIIDLRNHLFQQLEILSDLDLTKPEDVKQLDAEIDRSKAMAEIAGQLVESAKVEVRYLEVAGGLGTGFVEGPKQLEA